MTTRLPPPPPPPAPDIEPAAPTQITLRVDGALLAELDALCARRRAHPAGRRYSRADAIREALRAGLATVAAADAGPRPRAR